jgi:hypothetical protein
MDVDRIVQLVSQADAGVTPLVREDLARRVRRKLWRRRAVRGAAGMAVLLLGVALSVRMLGGRHEGGMVVQRTSVRDLRLECERLENQAELHERVAALIVSHERWEERVRPKPDEPAAEDAVAAQVERSALILLRRGERLASHAGTRDEGADVYRQIVRLFPQTRGGEAAQKKLDAMNSNGATKRKEQS